MKRTFLNTENGTFVSVDIPADDGTGPITVLTRSGRWGTKGRQKKHRADTPAAAFELYIACVTEPLASGGIELPPVLTYHHAERDETLRVRPPISRELSVWTRRHTVRRLDSLAEALRAYNGLLHDKTRAGFTLVPPPWMHGMTPPGEAFEALDVPLKGKKKGFRKRAFRRIAEPRDEFGPEWWWHPNGNLQQVGFQWMGRIQGPLLTFFEDGTLRSIKTLHDDTQIGPNLLFRADGTIEELGIYDIKGRGTFYAGLDGSRLTLFTETGNAPDGKRIGVWDEWDHENHIRKVYGAPDGYKHIIYRRLDGTLEQEKRFDVSTGRSNHIAFYNEDGVLTQARERQEGDLWLCTLYHPDGSTPASRGPLRNNRREGDWTTFDASGNPEEREGEVVLPPQDPMGALFHTLEHCTYIPTPRPAKKYSEIYGDTNADEANLPKTLEDAIARLYCIAHHQPSALKPTPKHRGAWKHTSQAGSRLELERTSGRVKGGALYRADGTRAADFVFSAKKPNPWTAPHLSITLYHPDGERIWRSGSYLAQFPYFAPETVHVRRDGWWFDTLPDGRLARAQCFSSGSYNLAADHHYGPDFYDHSDVADERSFTHHANAACKAAGGTPVRDAFKVLCQHLEQAFLHDSERCEGELIPALADAVEAWPSRLRAAPLLWINRLICGALPTSALHLTSALVLTPAMTEHHLSDRHYPALIFYLSHLPPDVPALEGLSISMDEPLCEALKAAIQAEPAERFHPESLELDETFHRDPGDPAHLKALLGSPLARNLRMLDASWVPTPHDFWWTYQGFLDGRGLTLGDVAEAIVSERLEILDLHGQARSPRDPLGRQTWSEKLTKRLACLTHLDLGGGHPIGDTAVLQVMKRCPALRALSLRPGQAGDVLYGYDFAEWEREDIDSVYALLHEHWNIYDNNDIESMRLTQRGLKALSTLEMLQLDRRLAEDAPEGRLAAWGQSFMV